MCGSIEFVTRGFNGLSAITAVRLRQKACSDGTLSLPRSTNAPPPKADKPIKTYLERLCLDY